MISLKIIYNFKSSSTKISFFDN